MEDRSRVRGGIAISVKLELGLGLEVRTVLAPVLKLEIQEVVESSLVRAS